MDSEASVQRQIELQSPDDLSYLVANVRRAAQGHLNEAFPPMEGAGADGGEEDELRTQIERYVNEYITETFTHAAPNLSINGLPADTGLFADSSSQTQAAAREPQVEYEPWDASLRSRVEELAQEEEKLLNEVAALKKSVPAHVAAEHGRRFRDANAKDDELLKARKHQDEVRIAAMARGENADGNQAGGGQDVVMGEDGAEAGSGKGASPLLDVGRLERQGDVERAYGDAVVGLGRVKREMPSTVARMERARVAGEYVVTERS